MLRVVLKGLGGYRKGDVEEEKNFFELVKWGLEGDPARAAALRGDLSWRGHARLVFGEDLWKEVVIKFPEGVSSADFKGFFPCGS